MRTMNLFDSDLSLKFGDNDQSTTDKISNDNISTTINFNNLITDLKSASKVLSESTIFIHKNFRPQLVSFTSHIQEKETVWK